MKNEDIEVFYPKTRKAWRSWLMKNHGSKSCVWLVYYKKGSGKPSISWTEAVEEALCFGWIDSKKVSVDHEQSQQYFSLRKPKSVWSAINKKKVEELIEQNLMTEAGLKCVEIAKENGSWTILDEAESLVIPGDLKAEFKKYKKAKQNFEAMSRSSRKTILQWLLMAKREETRNKRIEEIASLAEENLKPKQFR